MPPGSPDGSPTRSPGPPARGATARAPLRLAVDASPLDVAPRRGVARALAHLLDALRARDDVVVTPWRLRPGERPRALRRRAAATLSPLGADAWYAPWSAFPAVRVPVVVCVHELPFVRHGPLEGRLRALVHRRWLARDVAGAAALVVPSRATADDVLTLHPEAAPRLHVVPHGFAPLRGADPVPGLPGPRRGGLVLGARGPRKGLEVLAAALHGLPAVPWTWVGRPTRRARAALPAGVELEVLDDPDDAEVAARLARAAVLAYPSWSEGFGYPPLEAMAAGTPVVACAAGAVPEVVGDAALLVAPGDVPALRAALARVLSDPAVRAGLASRGLVRARAFPPAVAAEALLKVVAAVVERGGA